MTATTVNQAADSFSFTSEGNVSQRISFHICGQSRTPATSLASLAAGNIVFKCLKPGLFLSRALIKLDTVPSLICNGGSR